MQESLGVFGSRGLCCCEVLLCCWSARGSFLPKFSAANLGAAGIAAAPLRATHPSSLLLPTLIAAAGSLMLSAAACLLLLLLFVAGAPIASLPAAAVDAGLLGHPPFLRPTTRACTPPRAPSDKPPLHRDHSPPHSPLPPCRPSEENCRAAEFSLPLGMFPTLTPLTPPRGPSSANRGGYCSYAMLQGVHA